MRGDDVDEPDEEPEVEEPTGPPTERVRIHGAEAAGALVGGRRPGDELFPERSGEYAGMPGESDRDPRGGDAETPRREPSLFPEDFPSSTGREEGEQGFPAEPSGSVPLLPHWTDPPTGQVPAAVARHDEDDGSELWTSGGPSWREHDHEWEQGGFEPSLLGDDETRLGALEEAPLSERRPWEFGDLASTGELDLDETETEPVEETAGWAVGRRSEDLGGEDQEVGSFWEGDYADDEPGVGRDVGRSADTRAGRASRDSRQRSDPPEEGRFVASISSSPIRGISAGRGSGAGTQPRGHRRQPVRPGAHAGGGAGRNLPVAIATGVGFAALALLCFALGSVATLVLSTVVVTIAAAECYAALRRAGRRPAALLGLVATVGVMVSAYAKGVSALPLVLALVVVTSMIWYLAGVEKGSPVEGIVSTVFGFVWVGLLASFAALMLAPSQYPHRHGVAFMLGAVIATVAADVGALVVGGWLGRHPLAPRVSPQKTWEGFIGGAILAVAASAAITGQVHPWTPGKAAVLGLVVAVVAPVGDLCESLIKRDLNLKDMGSLLPGHGGVLDRVDALLFVLPVTYYLVRVLHLG
jgi:phosphatidate cytidylyltransferase